MGLGMDYSQVAALCEQWNVPYTVVKTEIAPIIFDHRKEKNPCSMCAKMRRGALNQAILDKGFNKLALGHHYDDAVETFLMSLLFEGRINCFQPVTNLDRTGIVQIRPMLYIHEKTLDNFAARMNLPVLQNRCPVDKAQRGADHPGDDPLHRLPRRGREDAVLRQALSHPYLRPGEGL